MSDDTSWTTDQAFHRYEALRPRMPDARFGSDTIECSGLIEIAGAFDAFLLDSFGVLNVGETAIPGAVACLETLRAMGKRLIVLTNAASYPRAVAVARYHRLGFDFTPDEVVSSRDVAARRLEQVIPNGRWGAIAAPDDQFEDIEANVSHWDGGDVDGYLLLSSAAMSGPVMTALADALRARAAPVVVANPDLVAPRECGLSKEPGYYAHLLGDQTGLSPVFFGKPYGHAFADALDRLGNIPVARVAMVGDTLHTDILGGRAVGAKTVLVRKHGLFAGHPVGGFVQASGIIPDYVCDSI